MAKKLTKDLLKSNKKISEDLLSQIGDKLYSFVYFVTLSENESLYILSKVLIDFQKNYTVYDKESSLYLFYITCDLIFADMNRLCRFTSFEPTDENDLLYFSVDSIDFSSVVLSKENRDKLRYAASSIPTNLRIVFFLKDYCEFSYDEIASILSLSRDEVAKDLSRARRMILKKIELNTKMTSDIGKNSTGVIKN